MKNSRFFPPIRTGASLLLLWLLLIAAGLHAQPIISSFSPAAGPVGTTVTINGSGFSSFVSGNTVFFGGVQANVLSASPASLTVRVPTGTSYLPLSVTANNLTAYSAEPFIQTFDSCGTTFLHRFDPKVDFSAGTDPYRLLTGDMNGDGKPDVLVTQVNSSNAALLINTSTPGNVSFGNKIEYPVYGQAQMADFNGDGKLDLVFGAGTGMISILRNNSFSGMASFAISGFLTANCRTLDVGDIDLDGKPDLVLGHHDHIAVWKNTSTPFDISFTLAAQVPATGVDKWDMAVTDIDGDKRSDVIVVNYNGFDIDVFRNTTSGSTISFASPLNISTGTYHPTRVAVGDIDGDGKTDFAVTAYNSNMDHYALVYRNISNTGNLALAPAVKFKTPQGNWDIALSDLNGDKRPEMMTANYIAPGSGVALYRNLSTPGFISFFNYYPHGTGSLAESVTVVDVDGDTRPDVIVGNRGSGSISVLRNKEQMKPRITAVSTPSTCNVNNGKLTVTAFNDYPPFSYSMDGVNFQNNGSFTNLAGGNYTITVKDNNGCTSSALFAVPVLGGPQASVSTGSTSCNNTAALTVTATSGTPPYRYSLDGINFQSSNVFNNLAPGSYSITVRDQSGCTAVSNATILPYNLSLNTTVTSPSCGSANGSIVAGASGSSSPFSFSINNGAFQSSGTFSPLPQGSYTIRVRDAAGCIKDTVIVLGDGCISLTSNTVNATCSNSNGSITLTATGGILPYRYSLDGVNFQSSNSFTSLPAGTYTGTVRDAGGAATAISITLGDSPAPGVSVLATPASCSNDNGSIAISTQGGTAPLSYSINGGSFQSSPSFNGLSSGSYTLAVKDANGCLASASATVPLQNNLVVDAGRDQVICEGSGSRLQASSNGTSFSWQPAASLSNATALNPTASPASTTAYTLTASSGACTATGMVTITVLPAPVANAGADATICVGKNIQLNGSGGVSYSWSPSLHLDDPAVANPMVLSPPKGNFTYLLTVKDANGCSSLSPSAVRIHVDAPVVLLGNDTVVMSGQPLQLRAVDGSGAGFTSYSWSPLSGLSNPLIKDPVAVNDRDMIYTLTARTADGCIATDDIKISVYKGVEIYVPTAFTPNADGRNDILKAIPVGIREFKSFTIYNRWGQAVFSTPNSSRGWDGFFLGTLQNGVFVWTAEGIDYNGNLVRRKGTVVVIR